MTTQITMPALSPTMEEGNLAKWHVKVGDTIEPGQVIAEIETDKATMEVEAVDEGVIAEILVAEGTQGVKVNTPIATLAGEDEAVKPAPSKPSPLAGRAGRGGQALRLLSVAPTPPPPAPPRKGAGRESSLRRWRAGWPSKAGLIFRGLRAPARMGAW